MFIEIVHIFAALKRKNKIDNIMIIIPVKEGENIDRALKKFKRKFEKTGVVKELRQRQQYDKPSAKRREQKIKAIYKQKMQNEEQNG